MTSYDAYWLKYLGRRTKLITRLLHYFGLVIGQMAGVALAFWFHSSAYLMICLATYGIAQMSRERNWAVQKNPYITKAIFNIMSFFRMMILDVTGKLESEIKRLQHPK